MVETRWWSKLFVLSAAICIFLLVSGPLGYKFGLTGLQSSLVSLLLALVGAGIVLVGALIMLFVALKNDLTQDRNLLVMAMIMSLVPMIAMTPQILKGSSVPQIHDISTDTANPPQFSAVLALRKKSDNDLSYEYQGSSIKQAELQVKAYPEVRPLMSDLEVSQAVSRAAELLAEQGLEIVNTDQDKGIVEATATTFWFGFKDDLVVRVRPHGTGSIIDVRSVSRVGVSDVGVNAARIMKFTAAF